MLTIGLTGGIGSGKSLAARYFSDLDAPIIDADKIAHDLLTPGQPAFDAVIARQGRTILTSDGAIDRRKLGTLVFEDPEERRWLEAQLHPPIRARIQAHCQAATSSAVPYVIVVIPLLVETDAYSLIDRIVVVDCPESVQIERTQARDPALSQAHIKKIMRVQASRAERLAKADDVIINDGSRDKLQRQVTALHKQYMLG